MNERGTTVIRISASNLVRRYATSPDKEGSNRVPFCINFFYERRPFLSLFFSLSLLIPSLVFPFITGKCACRRKIVGVVRNVNRTWIWNSPSPMGINSGENRASIPLDEIWSLRKRLGQGLLIGSTLRAEFEIVLSRWISIDSFMENFFRTRWKMIIH